MKNSLYRSETNRTIAGVCGGLGEFLGIDPLIIRIFFIVWTILGEFSVLVYFILWVVIPNKTASDAGDTFKSNELGSRFSLMGRELGNVARQPSQELITFAGVGLIGWGVYYLLRQFGFPFLNWNFSFYLWPALLIIAGAFILIRATTRK
ncbi:MAG: PspC domain-containing protein [Anaerolineaceae bacterium]|nr:PspC domain-containing protein [Anaerolineaceae bacterium]